MPYMILAGAVALVLVMWFVSIRHMLVMLNENINNAMCQIGVQLSMRWDALSVLLDLSHQYVQEECGALSQTMRKRRLITAESSIEQTVEQEQLLRDAMDRIAEMAEQHPSLKADLRYAKTMDSVNQYEGMVHQSRLIYNDGVTRLNRQIRLFPASLAAVVLGIQKRNYLEASLLRIEIAA